MDQPGMTIEQGFAFIDAAADQGRSKNWHGTYDSEGFPLNSLDGLSDASLRNIL